MSIATVVTRGYGVYSNVHGVPVRGYIGNSAVSTPLVLTTWAWGEQPLLFNQRQSVILALASWLWGVQPLLLSFPTTLALATVSWLWRAFTYPGFISLAANVVRGVVFPMLRSVVRGSVTDAD